AERSPGDARLLNQAAHHYRACLSHAPSAGDADPVFAGARRNLQRVERLLAEARPSEKPPAPARAKLAAEPPAVSAKPNPEATRAPAPAGRKMAGPDGVIYRPVGEEP